MCIMHILFSFRHGLHGLISVDIHKNRVNPCNPCLKMISVYFIHSHISFRFSLQVAGCGLRFLGGDLNFLEKNPIFDARFRFFPHL